MSSRPTFHDHNAIRPIATPGTYPQAATKLTYTDITGFNRIVFEPFVAELAGDAVCTIYQATDSSGTGAKVLSTSITKTFVNGIDEGRIGILEVRAEDLDVGFNFVTLEITPAGGTLVFACTAHLMEAYNPGTIANGTPEDVAWIGHN